MPSQLPLFDNNFKLNINKPIAFFDLETTGTNITNDRIVEISIVRISPPDEKVEIKTFRVNPGMPIPEHASAVHGIYDKDVANEPTFETLAPQVAQFLKDCDLGGFNSIRFDIPLLVEEFHRAGIDLNLSKRKLVDAQKIFHLMEPRTLSAAYRFYCNKELIGAHGAEADALATFEVLKAQVQRYENKPLKDSTGKIIAEIKNDINSLHQISSNNMVDLAGRMIYNDKGEVVFNFGKYKGLKVVDVLKKDPNYYDWMQNGDFAKDTKAKLTQIKIQILR
jgi:DNA polymerase-3 subunit epsilon